MGKLRAHAGMATWRCSGKTRVPEPGGPAADVRQGSGWRDHCRAGSMRGRGAVYATGTIGDSIVAFDGSAAWLRSTIQAWPPTDRISSTPHRTGRAAPVDCRRTAAGIGRGGVRPVGQFLADHLRRHLWPDRRGHDLAVAAGRAADCAVHQYRCAAVAAQPALHHGLLAPGADRAGGQRHADDRRGAVCAGQCGGCADVRWPPHRAGAGDHLCRPVTGGRECIGLVRAARQPPHRVGVHRAGCKELGGGGEHVGLLHGGLPRWRAGTGHDVGLGRAIYRPRHPGLRLRTGDDRATGHRAPGAGRHPAGHPTGTAGAPTWRRWAVASRSSCSSWCRKTTRHGRWWNGTGFATRSATRWARPRRTAG
ncbi:hypothetical protein G6F31_014571 [Rhizopus arrhizus]|nr:hypothetical protein G6F31_014571 [Rhizopus arrhizus]